MYTKWRIALFLSTSSLLKHKARKSKQADNESQEQKHIGYLLFKCWEIESEDKIFWKYGLTLELLRLLWGVFYSKLITTDRNWFLPWLSL